MAKFTPKTHFPMARLIYKCTVCKTFNFFLPFFENSVDADQLASSQPAELTKTNTVSHPHNESTFSWSGWKSEVDIAIILKKVLRMHFKEHDSCAIITLNMVIKM